MYLINRHLLSSVKGPFFFGLSVITFLLMIDTLFSFVDLFVTKGVPFWVATQVLLLSLPHTFALSIPMSVLVAVLMGVGQLAADNEITALKASGVSLYALLRPLLLGAALVALALTAYNHFFFPRMNHTLAGLIQDINRTKPMLQIQPQQFTDLNDRMTIFVGSKDDITGRIEDVTIIEKEGPGDLSPRMTFAAWGRIITDHENDLMTLELHDGETHEKQDKNEPDKYQVIRFSQHNRTITDAEQDLQRTERKAKTDREMDLNELLAAAGEERKMQDGVNDRVRDITGSFLRWEWNLLSDAGRKMVLASEDGNPKTNRKPRIREERFEETRTKVRRVAEQAQFQTRVLDTYVVKENKYLVEFHKKFSIPFACVVFAVLGVPMAVTTSRSGKGISASLAIAVFLVYYLFLVGGEKMADRGRLDPFLAMWSANFVLLAVGVPIFVKTVKESSVVSITLKPKSPKAVSPRAGSPGTGQDGECIPR